MQIRFYFLFAFLLAFSIMGFSQTKEELQKQEKDLQKELADLNRLYAETQKNKKSSLKQLAIIKSKIKKREELVYSINKQVRRLDETIYLNEVDVYRLKKELDTLKAKYAKSLVFAYRNRSSYEYLNFLFSAANFNDAIKRITYLKSYRQNRETQANTIIKSSQLLRSKIATLNLSKQERLGTLQIQNSQIKDLQVDKKEQDQVVSQIKGRETEISKQISAKEKQRRSVQTAFNAIIRREIEEARKKEAARLKALDDKRKSDPATVKSNLKNESVTGMAAPVKDRTYSPLESTPEGREMSINFENNKGRLPWPVATGVVTARQGTEMIPGTKLKRVTDGIEISLPAGTTVRSVADGKVVYSGEVGGQQVLVIQHGKYFSGYQYMSNVNVGKDQEVKAGTVIGKTGVSIDGEGILIFSIMNDRSVQQDPEDWLKPRR